MGKVLIVLIVAGMFVGCGKRQAQPGGSGDVSSGRQAGGQNSSMTSQDRLEELAIAGELYRGDNDGRLPTSVDAAAIKQALSPFAKSQEVFVQPSTGQPYSFMFSRMPATMAPSPSVKPPNIPYTHWTSGVNSMAGVTW